MEDTASDGMSTKEIIKEFCSYTTTHGVGRLAEAKTRFSQFIWTGFVLSAFAMFFYEVHGLFVLYYSCPVSTVTSLKPATVMKFPAVTVCNQNPIKKDQVREELLTEIKLELEQILQKERNNKKGTATPATDVQSPIGNNSATAGKQTDLPTRDRENHSNEIHQELRRAYLFEELLWRRMALANVTRLRNMGHQFEDLVFECNFRGIDCRNYSKYWYAFWNPQFGNCFKFNNGVDENNNKQTVLKTNSAGPSGGLDLILFLESSKYVYELTETVGARIVVHDQDSKVFPDDEGSDLHPGMSTSIGVKRVIIKTLDRFKNGSCRGDGDEVFDYRERDCTRECIGDSQIQSCGCAERRFTAESGLVCDTLMNRTAEKCLDDLMEKFHLQGSICDTKCPRPCSQIVFETSNMHIAEWPSDVQRAILFNELVKENAAYEKERANFTTFVEKNFLRVRVMYERIIYKEIQEQRTYEAVNLLADIGGQLGLWIGISALTCCEVLELVLMLAQRMFTKMNNKSRKMETPL